MAFIISLTLLLAFTANVAIGALGEGPLVGNVAESLMLTTASVSFVVGILQREAKAKKGAQTPDT
jgi:hypothetical protein